MSVSVQSAAPSLALNARILLVEDNELNRDMLSRRLSRRGFAVSVAVDGAEAQRVACENPPDLILMDMNMPIVDGWQATKQLKADPETAEIPIIGLTAHAMEGDREKCLAVGCDDYDTKPVDFDRLIAKIEQQLARTSLDVDGGAELHG